MICNGRHGNGAGAARDPADRAHRFDRFRRNLPYWAGLVVGLDDVEQPGAVQSKRQPSDQSPVSRSPGGKRQGGRLGASQPKPAEPEPKRL